MKRIFIITLSMCCSCLAAEKPSFPELPDTPSKLIETLKTSGDGYTVLTFRLDYVKESDLPYLIGLLDSKEPCAHVVLSASSIYYPGKSTVGHEAAYLIEGFWKRYYPTRLTSSQYKPDLEDMKTWYRMWSNMKKLAEPNAPANGASPSARSISDAEIRKLATQYRDDWLSSTKPESADRLRIGIIQSIERTGDGWHVAFVTETGHDQPEGMHDYFLHVYIDSTGKLQKIERGPDKLS